MMKPQELVDAAEQEVKNQWAALHAIYPDEIPEDLRKGAEELERLWKELRDAYVSRGLIDG